MLFHQLLQTDVISICFGQIANEMQRNQNQLILTSKYLPIQLFDIFKNIESPGVYLNQVNGMVNQVLLLRVSYD